MIKVVKDDLLQAEENIIAHQVNCQGAMNSGVAKQIRQASKKVYDEYKQLVDEHNTEGSEDLRNTLLGSVQGVSLGENRYVANLFGQANYGYDGKQYTSVPDLFKCFKKLRAIAESNNMSVAMPYKIGCYRGGADWEEVFDLLLTAFEGYEVTLYKYHEGK